VVPVSNDLPGEGSRSTMAAHSRGSVKVLVQATEVPTGSRRL
jgi:hypothetical protein